ncbi:hypothetical protein GQ43DRAFT_150315 [Delitschia confertaspora ATCC 74209]|uniref:Uncharacterized protein n=1 Tax=Delitschia confertaspora ATCC 74209 TaxID=1513339 RepID=A0A9P4JID3_9PLEO|nr:hypothetical protein GQ43DRAFT_150315 [Delitschia confertaspora ATCC 74209]
MAHIDTFQSRIRFLKESAYLLSTASPTASAVLGAHHDRLLETDELDLQAPKKDWDAHRREFCGACGNLMVPGWSCKVTHEICRTETKLKKTKAAGRTKQAPKPEKMVVYHCLRCERRTIQTLSTRPSKHVKTSYGPLKMLPDPIVINKESKVEETKVVKSANASSKQRAKARKQSGLQAMLAKSKTQTSSGPQKGFGLDLMDFL